MAEYGKVQFETGSDGNTDIGDPAMDAAREEAGLGVEAPEEQQDEALDNIVDKFGGDFDKLASAYRELEQRQSIRPEPTATAAVGEGLEELQPFVDEWIETGELSAKSRNALTEKYPAELVEDYLRKAQAAAEFEGVKQDQERESIYASVGGEEAYRDIVLWASDNMDAADIAAFNASVENGTYEQARFAVQGLQALRNQAEGPAPKLLESRPHGLAGTAPYESLAQLMEEMRDPKYKEDEAFRAKVHKRLSVSNVM